jgi:hypothetical protein
MLVNKDQQNSQQVHIIFDDEKGAAHFTGQINVATFGSDQYQRRSNVKGGTADPDGPDKKYSMTAAKDGLFTLPKASVTVIRGKLETR